MGTRPSNLDLGTVTGTFLTGADDPWVGYAQCVPDLTPKSVKVTGQAWRAVDQVTATLDGTGTLNTQLIASTDPDATPTSWTWTVTIFGSNGNPSPFPSFTFTLAPNQTVDLDTVVTTSVGTGTPNVIQGPPGTSITAGTGAPAGASGQSGDLYVETVTGDLYRKGGGTTWTTIGNLRGPAGTGAAGTNGTNGTDGKSVELQKSATAIQWRQTPGGTFADLVLLSALKGADGTSGTNGTNGSNGARGSLTYVGAGAPGTITGQADGDTYLDSTSGDYYQRASSAWSKVGNLRGPIGLTGNTGQRGQGVLVLAAADAVPGGTTAGTLIARY